MNNKLTKALGRLEDWEYLGGADARGRKRWSIIMQIDMESILPLDLKCQCGITLKNKHYIRNIYNHKDIRVMGETCVKQFIKKDICCAECENISEDGSNICHDCGGYESILCFKCGYRYPKDNKDKHNCDDTKCCPSCDAKYIKCHTCPNEIISCSDCFLTVRRGSHDQCKGKYLIKEIRDGKYRGGRWGDVLFIDPEIVKELASCKHQSDFIERILESETFTKHWKHRFKETCPDCLFDCWPTHDCCGRLLWCSNSDDELWGDILIHDPKQFELMSIKYPFLSQYVGATPIWECKQDCPICFLNVRISEHECNNFLYQVDQNTDELWGDLLVLTPDVEIPEEQMAYVDDLLEYKLFIKTWQLSPRHECHICFLDVREAHICQGHILMQHDCVYKNGIWGDILKIDPEYIKSVYTSNYIDQVIKSKYFDKWISTPPNYCIDCYLFKGVHKCNGSILRERITGIYTGDLIKNGIIITSDNSFVNEVCHSNYFFEQWKLEPIIDCHNCFLTTTKYHKCMSYILFRKRKRGKYAGYLYGDVLKLCPKIVKLKGDELLYKKSLLKSDLFNCWIVYPPVLCPNCLLTISPIHDCRHELLWKMSKGKYIGKRWGDILAIDPNYIKWMIETHHSDNGPMISYFGELLECDKFANNWNVNTDNYCEYCEKTYDGVHKCPNNVRHCYTCREPYRLNHSCSSAANFCGRCKNVYIGYHECI
jgi:hypothetical protein